MSALILLEELAAMPLIAALLAYELFASSSTQGAMLAVRRVLRRRRAGRQTSEDVMSCSRALGGPAAWHPQV
jgi:hypothetical protein